MVLNPVCSRVVHLYDSFINILPQASRLKKSPEISSLVYAAATSFKYMCDYVTHLDCTPRTYFPSVSRFGWPNHPPVCTSSTTGSSWSGHRAHKTPGTQMYLLTRLSFPVPYWQPFWHWVNGRDWILYNSTWNGTHLPESVFNQAMGAFLKPHAPYLFPARLQEPFQISQIQRTNEVSARIVWQSCYSIPRNLDVIKERPHGTTTTTTLRSHSNSTTFNNRETTNWTLLYKVMKNLLFRP